MTAAVILAEKPERRDAAKSLEEWLNLTLRDVGVRATVYETHGGWLAVEAPDPQLITSILRLNSRLPPTAKKRPVLRTVKVKRLGEKTHYEYPLEDGGAGEGEAEARAWAAALGHLGGDVEVFLRAVGIVEGGPINLTLNTPSILQLRFVEELRRGGLDAVILTELAPHEVEEVMAQREVRGLIAGHIQLTPLTHILTIRLGAKAERALNRVEKVLRNLGLPQKPALAKWRERIGPGGD